MIQSHCPHALKYVSLWFIITLLMHFSVCPHNVPVLPAKPRRSSISCRVATMFFQSLVINSIMVDLINTFHRREELEKPLVKNVSQLSYIVGTPSP